MFKKKKPEDEKDLEQKDFNHTDRLLEEDLGDEKPKPRIPTLLKAFLITIFVSIFIVAILLSVSKGNKSNNKDVSKVEDGVSIDLSKSPVSLEVVSKDLEELLLKDIYKMGMVEEDESEEEEIVETDEEEDSESEEAASEQKKRYEDEDDKHSEVFDEITILEMIPQEITQDQSEKIREKVSGDAAPISFKVKAKATSIQSEVQFAYNLIYVKFSGGDHLIFSEVSDKDKWKYLPREGVNVNQVLESLREIKFPGFEEGYVGSLENSNVTINEEVEDLENSKERINATINIETPFANYKLKTELYYEFIQGRWVLVDHSLLKNTGWQIEYLVGEEPKEHSTDYIMNLVTDEDSYFSKVIDFTNVKEYNLNKPVYIPGQKSIGLQYGLNVEYEDLSIITYDITVPVEWTGESWADRNVNIDINSAIFNNSLGLWYNEDKGNTIMLERVENYRDQKGRDMQKVYGRSFELNKKKEYDEKALDFSIQIPLRSEAYSGTVITTDKENNKKKLDVVYDLKSKEMIIDGTKYFKVDKKLGIERKVDIQALIEQQQMLLDKTKEIKKEKEDIEKSKVNDTNSTSKEKTDESKDKDKNNK